MVLLHHSLAACLAGDQALMNGMRQSQVFQGQSVRIVGRQGHANAVINIPYFWMVLLRMRLYRDTLDKGHGIQKIAEFKFTLQSHPSHRPQFPVPLKELIAVLREDGIETVSEETLASRTFEIMKRNQVEPRAFFQDVYRILVNKPNGPKLASFLLAIGPKRSSEILEKTLEP